MDTSVKSFQQFQEIQTNAIDVTIRMKLLYMYLNGVGVHILLKG